MPLVRISLVKGKPEAYSNYLGIARTSNLVIVQITLSVGRRLEQKRALYRQIAANLAAAVALRPEDAWINLVEVARENWSFGNGDASYVPKEEKDVRPYRIEGQGPGRGRAVL